jgi:hypothetical protein
MFKMFTQGYSSEKLKNGAKIVAGVIGIGGTLLFIITLAAAGQYGGITFWAFVAAAIPCTIYIFLAWLVYHIINVIAKTFENTEKIVEKVNRMGTQLSNTQPTINTPAQSIINAPTEPTKTTPPANSAPLAAIPVPEQKTVEVTTPNTEASVETNTEPSATSNSEQNRDVNVEPISESRTEQNMTPTTERSSAPVMKSNIAPVSESSTVNCKVCGFSYDKNGNFCPKCGLKNAKTY